MSSMCPGRNCIGILSNVFIRSSTYFHQSRWQQVFSFIGVSDDRCVRNCFQCPICFSGLSVFPNEETQAAPYTLNCTYCQWSSSEIGIEFEKPTGISGNILHCSTNSRTISKVGRTIFRITNRIWSHQRSLRKLIWCRSSLGRRNGFLLLPIFCITSG